MTLYGSLHKHFEVRFGGEVIRGSIDSSFGGNTRVAWDFDTENMWHGEIYWAGNKELTLNVSRDLDPRIEYSEVIQL